ncbi:hypothetical protein V6N13_028553 [Hibiscus sabdariffa]|uniref:Uncharacterized protein n=1 Tax=Hibiscus sabdariffa TaxID=183260 RepID=A0ABR2DAG6_9ROSI
MQSEELKNVVQNASFKNMRNRKKHALLRWLCQAKSYNLPGHTVKATMWDCNTSGCHLQGFKFLSINLKGIELQRAPGKNPEVANHCHCVRQVLD